MEEEENMRKKIAVGYKFLPSDKELINYVLERALQGRCSLSVGDEGVFKEYDVYAVEPYHLLHEAEAGGAVYVFTKLKRKTNNGVRIDRTVVGQGTWKERDNVKTFRGEWNQIIGWRRGFNYAPNTMTDHYRQHQYRMMEYSLHDDVLTHAKIKDFVLCKIKKLKKRRSRDHGGRSQQEHDHSVASISSSPELDQTRAIHESSLVELAPMAIENETPPPYHPCTPMPLSSAPPSSTACEAEPIEMNVVDEPPTATTFSASSSSSQSGLQLEELVDGDESLVDDLDAIAMSIDDQNQLAPVNLCYGSLDKAFLASLKSAHQAQPMEMINVAELSAILGSSQDSLHHPAEGLSDYSAAAVEPNSPLNQSFPASLDDGGGSDDDNLDWPEHFAAQLRQFLSPSEHNEEVKMLSNSMDFLMDDVFFKGLL